MLVRAAAARARRPRRSRRACRCRSDRRRASAPDPDPAWRRAVSPIWPIHSCCIRRASSGAKIEKRRAATRRPCASRTAPADRSPARARNSVRTSSFMGVKRAGFAAPFERFEVQLGQIHAVPIEALDQRLARPATRRESSRDWSGSSACASRAGRPAAGRSSRATPDDRPRISR